MEYKALKFKMENITEGGDFEGYASTRSKDLVGDIVEEGAFKRTLDHSGGRVPLLFFHDPMKPIGMTRRMEEDSKGLYTEGRIDLDTEVGRDVYSGMKKGYIDRMSIGYNTLRDDYDREKDARVLKEVKLMECSMITKNFAANEEALLTRVKSLHYLNGGNPHLIHQAIEALEALLADSQKSTPPWESPCGTPEVKKVIGSNNLPLGERKQEWNGDEASKRVFDWAGGSDFDPEKVKRAFFYIGEDEQNKTAYKLGFADIREGRLVAMPRGIFAVAGVLDGARGGVDIPEREQSMIKEKVSKYYGKMRDKFNDESIIPPWDKNKSILNLIRKMR